MELTTPGGLVFDTDDFGVDPESVTPEVLHGMDQAYQAGLAIRAMFGGSISPDLVNAVSFEANTNGGFSANLAIEDPVLRRGTNK